MVQAAVILSCVSGRHHLLIGVAIIHHTPASVLSVPLLCPVRDGFAARVFSFPVMLVAQCMQCCHGGFSRYKLVFIHHEVSRTMRRVIKWSLYAVAHVLGWIRYRYFVQGIIDYVSSVLATRTLVVVGKRCNHVGKSALSSKRGV